MVFRSCSFKFTLVSMVFMASCAAVSGLTAPAQTEGIGVIEPKGILEELAPDGVPASSLKLKPLEKARAIRLLKSVKRNETDLDRKQLANYFLATLGHDYELNLEELLTVWRGCVTNDFGHGCNEDTADLLIKLRKQGHKGILRPLLEGWRYSDGALAEILGDFYGESLERNPKEFVTTLTRFPPKDQKGICELAGGGDGGGMSPETERRVLTSLKVIGGDVANRSARSVRAGINDSDNASSDQPRVQRQTN